MVSKKPPKKKGKLRSKRKKSSKGNPYKVQLIKVLMGTTLLFALVLLVFVLAHNLLLKPTIKLDMPPVATQRMPSEVHLKKPTYEIFPKKDQPPSIPIKPPEKGDIVSALPKIAIIVDDVGYDLNIIKEFIKLEGPLTFAILPQAPYKDYAASAALAEHFEIMLHLPMEPTEYPRVNPGPGALLSAMDPDQLIAQLTKDIAEIPNIRGVNNHMGSKMTSSSGQMRQIFTILKKRGLFFIDSRTSSATICRSSAKLLKLPFAQRDVFIDHVLKPQFIRQQMKMLIQCARKNGYAVGIAHPHKITFNVLRQTLPEIKKEVQLVPASKAVHIIE
jgi:polysaccharide deacetylase 2 family uncharacterized protein YibQ